MKCHRRTVSDELSSTYFWFRSDFLLRDGWANDLWRQCSEPPEQVAMDTMKRQLTNRQEQVATDIIMNIPPWTNRHNQITTVDVYSHTVWLRSMCRWNGGVVSLIRMLPWLVQSACKMFARSSLWAPTRTRCMDVRTVSVICEPGFLLTKTWRHDDMYASWLQISYICRDGFISSFWTSLWRGSWFTMTSWGLYRTFLELLDVYELWRAQSSRSSQLAISPSSIYSLTCWTGSLEMETIYRSWEISHRHVAVLKRG